LGLDFKIPQSEIQTVMERQLIIKNKLGLHARAAAQIVQLSNSYTSDFSIRFDGQEVDGKSILSILTLACPVGSNILLRADGPDADELLEAMERLIDDKFGEE
jgi:phosphocarrier protein HPr